jgi:hypothetical protein
VSDDYVGGFIVLRLNDIVVNSSGTPIEHPKHIFKSKDKKYLVIGETNILIYDKKRELATREEALDAVKAGGVLGVIRV